ncbi:nucleolar protein [Streptomyces azureus]|uniref:Nucleolar protein n=1 Tax=Streptomyces azureus TaxID=146537 RepID=A0A0K8PTB2_STRAJ|nr:nucleolar protein [Streptomyces azureus]
MPGQPVALTGAQRIGQGVEEIGVARVERADDHIGHGIPPGCMVRRALPVRSVEARRDEEQGALERCELHGSALLPPVSGRDADTLRDHRLTVQRLSDAA